MNKEKICFIIMPISENLNYPSQHFKRVYEHLIIPACEKAGFIPIRADDVINTNYIALDVIKKIIESELVLCDLSSQNPNVLYELGIRQAFNKPVTLIKDKKTKRIFDIQGFRDFEYDESLRVDNVSIEINKLSEIMESTFLEKSGDVNSLVSLLSLSPAKIDSKTEISKETELILNSISGLEKRMRSIEDSTYNIEKNDLEQKLFSRKTKFFGGEISSSKEELEPLPDEVGDYYTQNELLNLKKGEEVFHRRFGFGIVEKVVDFEKNIEKAKIEITFSEFGKKILLLIFTKLRKVL